MKYPKEYLDEIKIRLKVSTVVSKHVSLKKRGKEFVGLSPFKNEKTPSFTVNDEKGFYHCFSTSEHGNIFDFVMKIQNLNFGEAVRHLAQLEKWGLNIRRNRNGGPHLGQLPGQSNPRTASTGDSTLREVRTILEEQCLKRKIPRRGDIEILDIVIKNESAKGLVALDIQSGEIFAIQSKSLILADSGFQSAWNGDSQAMGTSSALVLRGGISLANLEFTSMHPLTTEIENIILIDLPC